MSMTRRVSVQFIFFQLLLQTRNTRLVCRQFILLRYIQGKCVVHTLREVALTWFSSAQWRILFRSEFVERRYYDRQ
jgi:hypothetical protein